MRKFIKNAYTVVCPHCGIYWHSYNTKAELKGVKRICEYCNQDYEILPNIEQAPTSTYARKIASFLYASAVLEQEENNCIIHQDEIESRFEELPEGWSNDEQLIEEIKKELNNYPGLDNAEFSIERDDNNKLIFDLLLWTDYIASDYSAE
ncbi:MAG: hypothetical protein M0Q41_10795 [Bacteroidales bacterium]|nr:hypothetical protein [Acholeplasmataceae bacterium]MCK9449449.1 hypothetical protein [Bacteroidales bacterium]